MRMNRFRETLQKKHFASCAAAAILLLFFSILVLGMRGNTHNPDESCRIASGFTYLTTGNLRLNPEDPPLGKEIAALPLLLMNLELPVELSSLKAGNIGLGDSFVFAQKFLYDQKTQTPDAILFYPRLLMVLFGVGLGWLIFSFAKSLGGAKAGILALLLYCFSPTVLANTNIVGLDALGMFAGFLSILAMLRFFHKPTRLDAFYSAAALGFALLTKFTLLPLIVLFIILGAIWVQLQPQEERRQKILLLAGVFAMAFGFVFLFYAVHFISYPEEHQIAEVGALIRETKYADWVPFFTRLCKIPVLDVLLQLFIGIAYRLYHSTSFSYLLGHGYWGSHWIFYPFLVAVKEPAALPLFLLSSLALAAFALIKTPATPLEWVRRNFESFALALWICLYLCIALMTSNNDGLRHLLPVYPAVFVLCALLMTRFFKTYWQQVTVWLATALYVLPVIAAYPYYPDYVNVWIPNGTAFHYLANLDYHQNAKRLARWAVEHQVMELKVPSTFVFQTHDLADYRAYNYSKAYAYYLGPRYKELTREEREPGWYALPATLLAWGQATTEDEDGWGSDSWDWLAKRKPDAMIGNSIYIYHVTDVPALTAEDFSSKLYFTQVRAKRNPSAENLFQLATLQQSIKNLATHP